jgi:5S rRNA maturation endonuclease (ribonuclease M5)
MTSKHDTAAVIQSIIQTRQGQKQSDGSWNVLCPAHEDINPSCNIKDAGDKLLVRCYAGCSQERVISAFKSLNQWPQKINGTDITRPPGIMPIWEPKGAKEPKYYAAHWEYRNDAWETIGYTVRYDIKGDDKDIIPYFKRSGDKWRAGGPPSGPQKPIYGIEKLKNSDKPVLIVEGEKTTDASHKLVGKDYTCISWMGGTGSINKVDWTPIQGRDVFIWPDKDEPGTRAANIIKSKIPGARIISPPKDVPAGWDLADALAEGWTRDQVTDHIKTTAEDPEHRSSFKLVRLSDIQMKPADWQTDGFMEMDSLNLFFSDPGGAKTFLAIDQACCGATGKDFHGRYVRQGPVVYIAGEGQNGLKRRFTAWGIRHQIDLDQAPIFLSMMPEGLCDADQVNFVIEAIQAVVDQVGSPVLIVLDTVNRNFGPGDENSTKDMTGFIAGVDKIREKFRSCILLVHHSGHADKSRGRGSMALKGALDTEYRLEKDETGVIRVTCTKMKDHEPPEPMAFRLNTVELPFTDDQGRQITSAILDDTEYQPPACQGKKGRGKWQTVSVEVLKKIYLDQQKTLESGGYDPDQARVTLDDWRTACMDAGMNREAWRRIKDNLSQNPDVEQDGIYVFPC